MKQSWKKRRMRLGAMLRFAATSLFTMSRTTFSAAGHVSP
jgi:hypothetical protein